MTREDKRNIKLLKKQGKYEDIYQLYGRKAYMRYAPKKYKYEDLDKLAYEGKYEDIYLKYGKHPYKELLAVAKIREIELAYGSRSMKARLHRMGYRIKFVLSSALYGIGMGTGVLALSDATATMIASEMVKKENSVKYEEVIEEYEGEIQKYAENVKKLNLTPLETVLKLEDDLYNSSYGYGQPKLDIEGYFGVDMGQKNAYGVCRNIADDAKNKLNAINPEYNARLVVVRLDGASSEKPDIQINYINTKSDGVNEYEKLRVKNRFEKVTNKLLEIPVIGEKVENQIGNHVVVAMDIKEDNSTLIYDPTNLIIGIYKEGKIVLFNSLGKENPTRMNITPADAPAYLGVKSIEIPIDYIKTFFNPFMDVEKLNEKYGIDAQREALKSLKIKEANYIYTNSKTDDNQGIYSVEEIEEKYSEIMNASTEEITAEKALEFANISKKISKSLDYYDEKQIELIGRDIYYYAALHRRIDADLTDLRTAIVNQIIEANAINLPEEDTKKQNFLCYAFVQTDSPMQDLKYAVKEEENEKTYYIYDDKELISKVTIDDKGCHCSNGKVKQDKIGKELQKIAKPLVIDKSKDFRESLKFTLDLENDYSKEIEDRDNIEIIEREDD